MATTRIGGGRSSPASSGSSTRRTTGRLPGLPGDSDQLKPERPVHEGIQPGERRHQAVEKADAAQPRPSQQLDVDEPAQGAHRVAVSERLDAEAGPGQLGAQAALGVAAEVADRAVEGAHQGWMRRNQEGEGAAGLEQAEDRPHRRVVVRDVFEDAGAYGRAQAKSVQLLGGPRDVDKLVADVGAAGEPASTARYELG